MLDFCLLEWKHNQTMVAEEYCWAITEAVGRSRYGRSGSSVLDFVLQLDALV